MEEKQGDVYCSEQIFTTSCGITKKQALFACQSYAALFFWISTSISLIVFNKYLLSLFPFPATLTLWHMFFCSASAFALVTMKYAEVPAISRDIFIRGIVPVSALFSVSLYLNNLAYKFLSVAMLQILKATTPTVVFLFSVVFKLETFTQKMLWIMIVVCYGVAIASWGDINFNILGIAVQLGAVAAEGLRIVLIQVLLQSRNIKLNPIASMYYVLPVCMVFLLPFWIVFEKDHVFGQIQTIPSTLLFLNGLNAFALNYSVFLVIGATSALTMNIAGVVKDWLLISLSFLVFKDPISYTTLGGYGIAFTGVFYYNYMKLQSMQTETVKKEDVKIITIAPRLDENPANQMMEEKSTLSNPK